MDYEKAQTYILGRLRTELSSDLEYHGFHHTLNVINAAERIGKSEGLTEDEITLLITAASYHDAGFIEAYADNEHIAVEMAKSSLPEFGYSEEEIAQIADIILATKMDVLPKTMLQKVMCDADHDYLGRSDYYKIAATLRKELGIHGFEYSDEKWLELQVDFLENKHHFFTATAIAERGPRKAQTLLEIKDLLK
jgi:adenylate cyclase